MLLGISGFHLLNPKNVLPAPQYISTATMVFFFIVSSADLEVAP